MKHYPLFLLAVFVGALALFSVNTHNAFSQQKPASDINKILSECMTEKSPIHYHITLKITYLGTPMKLPNNIGVEDGCMKPIDTHDGSSEQIHIHYTRKYPFTIGNFFSVWGLIFNENQLGPTIASERRQIKMKVNGVPNADFEDYVMENGDLVEIAVTPGY